MYPSTEQLACIMAMLNNIRLYIKLDIATICEINIHSNASGLEAYCRSQHVQLHP